MYCQECGKEVDANGKFCIHCGASIKGDPNADAIKTDDKVLSNSNTLKVSGNVRARPKGLKTGRLVGARPNVVKSGNVPAHSLEEVSYSLLWPILTTLFCFLPFGIVSIVYTVRASNLKCLGQHNAAHECKEKADCYLKWNLFLSILGFVILFVALCVDASSGPNR